MLRIDYGLTISLLPRNNTQDFLEAEDPDAGIEEEYHPKNDT